MVFLSWKPEQTNTKPKIVKNSHYCCKKMEVFSIAGGEVLRCFVLLAIYDVCSMELMAQTFLVTSPFLPTQPERKLVK